MKLTLTTTRGPILVEVFKESVDVSGAYEALNGTYLGGTAEVIRVLVTAIEDLHYLAFFLRHRTGQVLDLTADQFLTPVPHDRAVGKGFLTRSPSRRARLIMQRVRAAAEAPFR